MYSIEYTTYVRLYKKKKIKEYPNGKINPKECNFKS